MGTIVGQKESQWANSERKGKKRKRRTFFIQKQKRTENARARPKKVGGKIWKGGSRGDAGVYYGRRLVKRAVWTKTWETGNRQKAPKEWGTAIGPQRRSGKQQTESW